MTNPNWWDVEPFRTLEPLYIKYSNGKEVDTCVYIHNIPLIIAEVEKRGEKKKAKIEKSDGIQSEWSCGNCKNELSHTEIDGSYCLWCGAEFE